MLSPKEIGFLVTGDQLIIKVGAWVMTLVMRLLLEMTIMAAHAEIRFASKETVGTEARVSVVRHRVPCMRQSPKANTTSASVPLTTSNILLPLVPTTCFAGTPTKNNCFESAGEDPRHGPAKGAVGRGTVPEISKIYIYDREVPITRDYVCVQFLCYKPIDKVK